MPAFALPLPPNSNAPLPRPNFLPYQKPRRKRKRASSDSPDEKPSPEPELDHAHASTNPLSLTPAEITQYRLAGLELDDELPSQGVDGVANFPHRGLPIPLDRKHGHKKKDKGKGKEIAREEDHDTDTTNRDEDTDSAYRSRGPGLHLRHLSVLTAILHKCLLGGDIPRASRAWSILIREQFWGRHIDLKASGYWAIGAELLIRSGEQRRRGSDADFDSTEDEDQRRDDDFEERWGSKDGWEKAKAYYEQLILQYPYRRQFQRNTNALDFWPAMVGCEIYGVQWEERDELRRLERGEGVEDLSDEELSPLEESEGYGPDEDELELASQRRMARQTRRKEEQIWQAKEEIRLKTLAASEAVAARMDELMSNHPYIDSHVLLRLRAMLTLYIGDLSVPAVPLQENEEAEGHRQSSSVRDSEHKPLMRQRQAEHERGKARRGELRAQAKKLFEKVAEKGGLVGEIDNMDEEDDAAPEFGF